MSDITTSRTISEILLFPKTQRGVFLILIMYVIGGLAIWQILPQQQSFMLQPNGSNPSDIAMCGAIDATQATVESKAHSGTVNTPVGTNISGLKKWSSGATWSSGSQPGTGDDVLIPANSVVILDQDINIKSLTVEGMLVVDITQNINISLEYIVVNGVKGYFEWGTPNTPYTKSGVITLRGNNKSTNIPGTNINYKAIVVSNNAKLELHGNTKKSWTRLGANAGANQNKITVSEDVNGWSVGDEVLIVSSRLNWNEAEKRTITAVSADKKTFTLNTNLSYPHIGVKKSYTRDKDGKTWDAEIRAEVGLLSKSIKIQGDANSANNEFGGHIMIHKDGIAHVESVELYNMGQKTILGRYPFHWHLLEDKGQGQYLKNSSIHQSYNRAITIHGTESTLVEGNFCYDHIGHGVFLENGSERFNVIKNNVVTLSKRPKAGDELTPSDNEMNEVQNRTPSQFWITNPNNTFIGNVAAGTEGTGFWFALPRQPLNESKDIPRFSNIQPFKEKLGVFSGNVSHSCKSGFDIFDQLTAGHSIIRNAGWERTDKRYIDKHIFYANDLANYGGIGGGRNYTESVVFREGVYSDNVTSLMHANYSTIENSVFIANSGENVFNGERKLNRGYDGSCTLTNCHMVGWDASNANYVQNTGGAQKHVNYRISGMTLSPDKSARMSFPDYSKIPKGGVGANSAEHPRFWSYIHWDKDGSLSGKANTSIITNHPLCRDGSEVRYANWNNLFRTDRRFAYLLAIVPGNSKMTLTRTKTGTPKAGQYYVNDDAPGGFYGTFIHFPVIVNDGFLYTMQFESLGTGKRATIHMKDAYTNGDEVLYQIKDFGRLAGLNISNASSKNSLNEVKASATSAWAKVGNDIYLKMKVGNNPDISCTITWSTNINLPKLDTDGDGISDYDESKAGTDPIPNDMIPAAKIIEWKPTVITNSKPEASFAQPTVTTLEEGYEELYFLVEASDPDGDNISLMLSIDGVEIRSENGAPYEWGQESNDPNTRVETLGLKAGNHEFRVVVTDSRGATTTITKMVSIIKKEVKVGPPGFTYVVDENGTVSIQGKFDIAYGTNNTFNYLIDQTSNITCTNSSFGSDPVPGVKKYCFIRESKDPFSGEPINIPGTIQTENYDKGGQNISYNDLDTTNNGGKYRIDAVDIGEGNGNYVIGWTGAGEWLEYTVQINKSAYYDFKFYVSSPNGGGQLSLDSDGEKVLTTIDVPQTSSWDVYTDFIEKVYLESGRSVFRLNIEKNGFNIDKIEIVESPVTGTISTLDHDLISVYPNPSVSGQFLINREIKWEVRSLIGILIKNGFSDSIDLSDQVKGIYLLKTRTSTTKLIID